MKIENISVSNINLTDNSAKLTFTLKELTKNVTVYLKINDGEYVSIFTNKTNSALTYNLTNLRRGVNTLFLKLISTDEEYISKPIDVKIKNNASIDNLNCSYTDSTGKYILNFTLSGDAFLKYKISINIDNSGYKQILEGQIMGDKSYEGSGLSLGSHKCKIKINDGYDEYESSEYSFEVKNHKPYLSDIAITDIKNSGTCTVYYGVKDIETTSLTHSIIIDGTKKTISPTKTNDFYSYAVTDLGVGKHTIYVTVSDKTDVVNSSTVTIELFQSSTNTKRLLEIAKLRYDFSYQQLKRIIETTISDGIFNYETENDVILKSQTYYKEMYAEFNRIALTSIDTIGNTKITKAKSDLNKEINDVYGAIDTLENTMETTFKDGVLSDSEKESLKSALNLVAKEKVDIDNDYSSLYNNEDLIDEEKSKLKSAYDNFISKHNTLVTTVNNISNKTGIIDNTDKSNLDTAFANWRTSLGSYRDASMLAIDAIARKKIDDGADRVNKYWSEIILEEGGIQSRVGSLETKVDGVGGINERLRSAEQIITTDGITNLIKDEFYTKETIDNKLDDVGATDWRPTISDMQEQIETTKTSVSEHTTALNDITSRVSTNESNITSINGDITSVTERISTAEQKITDSAITSVVSQSFYTKEQVDAIEIGVRNYFIKNNINNCAISGQSIVQNSAYRGFSFQVKEGEEWTLYRTDTTNNRWSVYWLSQEPKANTKILSTAFSDNAQTANTVNYLTVPTGVTWGFIYLSNQSDEIPNIMLSKGNKATDWTPAPEDTQAQLETQIENMSSSVEQTVNSWTAKITQNEKDITSLKLTDSNFEVTIKNKADSSNIISKINASTEGITINSSKINISGYVTFSALSTSGSTSINGGNITSGVIRGIKIISSTSDSTSRGELAGSGLNFYSPSKLAGTIFFDSNGEGTESSAKDRFLIQSKNGYVLKLLSSGDMSLTSADEMFLEATKVRINCNVDIYNTLTCGDITVQENVKAKTIQATTSATIKALDVTGGSSLTGNTICGGRLTVNGGVVTTGFTCNSSATISGAIYGLGSITLDRSYLTAPISSATRDYLRLGNLLIQGDNSYGILITTTSATWCPIMVGAISSNGYSVSSDERLKTDIKYINTDCQSTNSIGLVSPNTNITTGDMHEFVETLPMVSYRYIDELNRNINNTRYGFLAQEILYTKVGSELVEIQKDEYGNEIEGAYLRYSQDKYISFICGALQEEIKQRKQLEQKVLELEQRLGDDK